MSTVQFKPFGHWIPKDISCLSLSLSLSVSLSNCLTVSVDPHSGGSAVMNRSLVHRRDRSGILQCIQ